MFTRGSPGHGVRLHLVGSAGLTGSPKKWHARSRSVNLTEVGLARVAAMSFSIDPTTRPTRCLCLLPDDVAPPGSSTHVGWIQAGRNRTASRSAGSMSAGDGAPRMTGGSPART